MNISLNWLKRYIDFSMSPAELTAVLTSLGLECDHYEEIESIRGGLKGIVTGKVLTCEPHPDSDHLHITTVDIGEEEPKTIVCGAPNVAAGQNVIVATVGTVLYDGDKEIKIKKSKIRGVESSGMICAEDEIGIGSSHDGIMVLKEEVKPGTPASEYFNLQSDYCLEVELTPNRVDAASHYGVARDMKAYFVNSSLNGDYKGEIPEVTIPSTESFSPDRKDGFATVEVKDVEACPRYSGVTIRNVEVKESPEWLKNLLTTIGQRPINNIVDITNFVLNGLGQPLHCFDLDKVKDEKIVVRTCPAGTKFTTLDGVERELHEKDLMICDGERPMCIAGVFGGLDSGVTENTKNVFIESAYFHPTSIRKTARRHGLNTDASFRYERGTDPSITVYAAKLAGLLIRELAGGEICGEPVDVYPTPIEEKTVDLSLSYCKKLIGKEIPVDHVIGILRSLEITVEPDPDNKDILHLRIPTYRVDVTRPCDVVEEILRVYGYNNVEFGEEMHINVSQRSHADIDYELQELVSERLTGEGFIEIMNNSLSSESYYTGLEEMSSEKCVRLMNPLSNDLNVMRQSLLFGGLESISYNINRKSPDLRFYEFGTTYRFNPESVSTPEVPLKPYDERKELALWLTGDFILPSWNTKARKATPFDLNGIIFNLLRVLGIKDSALELTQDCNEIFSARLVIKTKNGKFIGESGILRKNILSKFDISQDVIYARLDWHSILKTVAGKNVTFSPLPKTQPVKRDLALLINDNVSFSQIEATVKKTERKLLKGVSLFDVYQGKNLPSGKKSYGISITLQDDEKTLTDKQIDAAMQKIIKALEQDGAELR